jgi:hypothetical protein
MKPVSNWPKNSVGGFSQINDVSPDVSPDIGNFLTKFHKIVSKFFYFIFKFMLK